MFCVLASWLELRLIASSIDWSTDWSIRRLIDWLIGWLIDWLIDFGPMGVSADPICLCGTGSSDDMSQRQMLKPNPIQKTSLLPLRRRHLGHVLMISRVGYVITDFWNQYINRLNFLRAWPCNGFFARPGKLAGRTEFSLHGVACSLACAESLLHGSWPRKTLAACKRPQKTVAACKRRWNQVLYS